MEGRFAVPQRFGRLDAGFKAEADRKLLIKGESNARPRIYMVAGHNIAERLLIVILRHALNIEK